MVDLIISKLISLNAIRTSTTKWSLRTVRKHIGLASTCVALIALLLTMGVVGVPRKFAYRNFALLYSAIAILSIAYAIILSIIQTPQEVVLPLTRRYARTPLRFVIVGMLGVLFFYLYPIIAAPIFLLIAVALLESNDRGVSLSTLVRPLLPAAYLFLGLMTVFGVNAVIVTVRAANYTWVVKRLDSFLLLGHNVSELSHRLCAAAPSAVSMALMICYFGLFAQIGAALLIISLKVGRDEGMKFVSTILLAYTITMAVFAVFPTYSPYFSCTDHGSSPLPRNVVEAQQSIMRQVALRQRHSQIPVDTEYYVSFPCMHITQPLIVLWFLRKWRRIFVVLLATDVVLVVAIVGLEWHYMVDLVGGVIVAAAAIYCTSHFMGPRSTQTQAA